MVSQKANGQIQGHFTVFIKLKYLAMFLKIRTWQRYTPPPIYIFQTYTIGRDANVVGLRLPPSATTESGAQPYKALFVWGEGGGV